MKEKNIFKGLSNNFWIVVIVVCILLMLFLGYGYSCFSNRDADIVEKVIEGGYVTLKYTDKTSGLAVIKAKPTTDSVGSKESGDGKCFDFSVEVDLKDAKKIEYEISVKKDSSKSNILDDDIRIYLEKEDSGSYSEYFGPKKYSPIDKKTKLGTEEGSMVISNMTKIKSGIDNYRLRVWLSDTSLIKDGDYAVEVNVVAKAK